MFQDAQDREFLISVVGKTSLSSIINLSLSINSLSEILLYGTGAGTGVLVRYRTSPAGTTVQLTVYWWWLVDTSYGYDTDSGSEQGTNTRCTYRQTLQTSETMNSSWASGNNHDILSEINAIIAGLVRGGKYGMKIRLPHAAVMTLLFRSDATAKDKLRIVLKSTFEHSKNLASFAAIYKVRFAIWSNRISIFPSFGPLSTIVMIGSLHKSLTCLVFCFLSRQYSLRSNGQA